MVLEGWKAFVSKREGRLPSLYACAAHGVVVGALTDLCGLGVEEAVVQDQGGSTYESSRESKTNQLSCQHSQDNSLSHR